MVYWFTGQPGAGKTVLGKKLHSFLKTEKRNWRQSVFHLDGDDLRELTVNKDYSKKGRVENIRRAQMITEFLHNNGCDVVVSLVAPYRKLREELKQKIDQAKTQKHKQELIADKPSSFRQYLNQNGWDSADEAIFYTRVRLYRENNLLSWDMPNMQPYVDMDYKSAKDAGWKQGEMEMK